MYVTTVSECLDVYFKKTIFFDNNLFFPESIFYEDNAILTTLFYLCKRFKYLEEPLYYYASAPTSVTNSSTVKKMSDRTTTIGMHMDNVKRFCDDDKEKELLNLVALRLCYRSLYMCAQFSRKEIKEVLDRTSKLVHNCLPNSYFKQMSLLKLFVVKHPLFSFYAFKIIRIIMPVYRRFHK